jgi:hypothetical protein
VHEEVEQIQKEVKQDFGDTVGLQLLTWREPRKPTADEQKTQQSEGSSSPPMSAAVAPVSTASSSSSSPLVLVLPPPWARTRLFLTAPVSEAFLLREIYARLSPLQRGLVWNLPPDKSERTARASTHLDCLCSLSDSVRVLH